MPLPKREASPESTGTVACSANSLEKEDNTQVEVVLMAVAKVVVVVVVTVVAVTSTYQTCTVGAQSNRCSRSLLNPRPLQ